MFKPSKKTVTIAAVPLVLLVLLLIAGVAAAAWINGTRVTGNASSAAAAYTLNTVSATPSTGSSGTCTATKTDGQNFAFSATNLDNTNSCTVTGSGTLRTGQGILGITLVINGTNVTADPASPVKAIFTAGCGASAPGDGGTGSWTLTISLDALDSSPGQTYDFAGTTVNAGPSSAAACVNANS